MSLRQAWRRVLSLDTFVGVRFCTKFGKSQILASTICLIFTVRVTSQSLHFCQVEIVTCLPDPTTHHHFLDYPWSWTNSGNQGGGDKWIISPSFFPFLTNEMKVSRKSFGIVMVSTNPVSCPPETCEWRPMRCVSRTWEDTWPIDIRISFLVVKKLPT